MIAAALLAGCSDRASGLDLRTPAPAAPVMDTSPAATPTSTPTPTPATPDQQVLAQYRAFWNLLDPLGLMPADQRGPAFAKVATDPEYTVGLIGMRGMDQLDHGSYGEIFLRPVIQQLDTDTARIRDCQDASQYGTTKRSTGQKLDVGTPNVLRYVSMQRGSDGVWRVSNVEIQPPGSC